MEKDAWNWNACPELPPVMLMSNHELARAIHKGMAIDYSRQSTERAEKNDIVRFGMCNVNIHALRTKHEPSDMKQLLIYDALFCLKHGIKPCDIQIENRIYQNNDVLIANPTFEDIDPIIEKIKEFDRVVREVKSGKMA